MNASADIQSTRCPCHAKRACSPIPSFGWRTWGGVPQLQPAGPPHQAVLVRRAEHAVFCSRCTGPQPSQWQPAAGGWPGRAHLRLTLQGGEQQGRLVEITCAPDSLGTPQYPRGLSGTMLPRGRRPVTAGTSCGFVGRTLSRLPCKVPRDASPCAAAGAAGVVRTEASASSRSLESCGFGDGSIVVLRCG